MRGAAPMPDVVLGDRFGAARRRDRRPVEAAFTDEGLRVARNAPSPGVIAQPTAGPAQGTHVVQIEIDRALYMDELARSATRRGFVSGG